MSTELKISLPDNLAREAEASGLLTPEAIESLLRDEIRRRRIDQLFGAADRLANLDMPTLTESEVEAEIEAARHLRRTSECELSPIPTLRPKPHNPESNREDPILTMTLL